MASTRKLPGVIEVHADPRTKRLLVRYDAARTNDVAVIDAVRSIASDIH